MVLHHLRNSHLAQQLPAFQIRFLVVFRKRVEWMIFCDSILISTTVSLSLWAGFPSFGSERRMHVQSLEKRVGTEVISHCTCRRAPELGELSETVRYRREESKCLCSTRLLTFTERPPSISSKRRCRFEIDSRALKEEFSMRNSTFLKLTLVTDLLDHTTCSMNVWSGDNCFNRRSRDYVIKLEQ